MSRQPIRSNVVQARINEACIYTKDRTILQAAADDPMALDNLRISTETQFRIRQINLLTELERATHLEDHLKIQALKNKIAELDKTIASLKRIISAYQTDPVTATKITIEGLKLAESNTSDHK